MGVGHARTSRSGPERSIVNPTPFVSVILPVINETDSLLETVHAILQSSDRDVREFLVIVCEKTTRESLAVCGRLKAALGGRLVLYHQRLPYLGGAMRDAFEIAQGSHVLMMASDLNTDPRIVRDFVAAAKQNPNAVITGCRWVKGGGFENYGAGNQAANFFFQRFFARLYGCNLRDLTYGYRLFPAELVKSIEWEELGHAFLFETILKPLRLGVPVIEIDGKIIVGYDEPALKKALKIK